MPNIATALREEITRLARKEIKSQTDTLRKTSAEYRRTIADLKRRVRELDRKVALQQKQLLKDIPASGSEVDAETVRYSAKGLRANRRRLGLSADDFGRLVGVSAQSVYNWESETTRPRAQQIARIAAVRTMGKREALARLEGLGSKGKARA